MIGHTERIWLMLISLTFLGALIGEGGHAGWLLTLTVAILMAIKGSVVIDHYMEMRSSNQRIRDVLRTFIILVPILVIFFHGWGEEVRQLTTLN
ncbi:MAG: cytochrome C oxidase subunit IV family protein [Candidatus Thiodiazotropha sp. (ex Monitilora ramsayi)]|nr:cytochrome C oxidase subunit IV family protein [Candidatus Thiodiazotropha sp. (ex Monitilora ramsayi)]